MQTAQFNIAHSFQVRRMSGGSFTMVLLLFLLGFFIIMFCVTANESVVGLVTGGIFFIMAIFNLFKKHTSDEVFIEIDVYGIWTNNREITNWSNYRCTYLSSKDSWNYGTDTDDDVSDNESATIKPVVNIEHYKDGESGYFIHQLFFNGSEDKVVDDVLNAIDFYYKNRKLNTKIYQQNILR